MENDLTSLTSLEAYAESLHGDPEIALKKLEGFSDPDSIRRRLAILIENNQIDRAIESLENLHLHKDFVDTALYAYALAGDLDNSVRCLEWSIAQNIELLAQKSALKFIMGLMNFIFSSRGGQTMLGPGTIENDELEKLRILADKVHSVCNKILARGRVEIEIESQLLQNYLDILFLIRSSQASVVCSTLATRTPLPIRIGIAILQGLIQPDSRLVNRLEDENPTSFDARLIACLILGRLLNDSSSAKLKASALITIAQDQPQREKVGELLYELWLINPEENDFFVVEKTIQDLLGYDSLLLSLIKADKELTNGNYEKAITLLEASRNDTNPRWLEIYAHAMARAGNRSQAFDLLNKLTSILVTSDLLLNIANLAKAEGRIDEERKALERAAVLEPENITIRRKLAQLLADSKDYEGAAKQFEILRNLDSEDNEILHNLAVSYALSGDNQKALSILEPSSETKTQPLEILRTRAAILHGAGQAEKAFDEVENAKELYWDHPEFVLMYMGLAYASGQEKAGHEALSKLQELREAGKVDDNLIRMVSFDEVKEWIEADTKRNDYIRQNILEGKLPWVMAAEMQREVPYWAWILKTQAMDWVWDEPLNRATYTIYSTNGIARVVNGQTSTMELIHCPLRGSPVVVDITALITLQNLGLIKEAVEFFGKVYIPAIYLAGTLEDTRKLIPHQRSQRDTAFKIIDKVANHQLQVISHESLITAEIAFIDEYSDQDSDHRLTMADLISVLAQNGFLNDIELRDAKAVSHKPESNNSNLSLGVKIIISRQTLFTLNSIGILEIALREFVVYILRTDYEDFIAESRAFNTLEEAYNKHNNLWKTLRSHPDIEFVSIPLEAKLDNHSRLENELALAGATLAKAYKLPLFVDDRACQMIVLNETNANAFSAFGTDAFLLANYQPDSSSLNKGAKAYLRLMEWRYRFLLMPPALLKSLADEYRNNPPGLSLRRVAKYVHDCMRDTGLFAGLESSNPPTSMAVRLYQSWARNVGELVMDVWLDEKNDENYALEFTNWAVSELLPSPPKSLNEAMQSAITSMTPMTVVTHALFRSTTKIDLDRSNLCLQAIASALGISNDEYYKIVTSVAR